MATPPVKIKSNVSITLAGTTFNNCYVEATTYSRSPDRIALTIMQIDDEIVDVVAVATSNQPDHPCPPDEVYVKDWSENEGMLSFLINNRIIKPEVTHYIISGYVHISRHQLTPNVWNKVKHLIKE